MTALAPVLAGTFDLRTLVDRTTTILVNAEGATDPVRTDIVPGGNDVARQPIDPPCRYAVTPPPRPAFAAIGAPSPAETVHRPAAGARVAA